MKTCPWIVNPPPQREGKRKLETPVPSPIAGESSSSVILDPANNQKRKLESSSNLNPHPSSVHSPLEDESPSNLKQDFVGTVPYSGLRRMKSFQLIAKVGLHCYNSHKGTHLRFAALTKTTSSPVLYCFYTMTLDAFDPHKKSLSKIRTCVRDAPGVADLTLVITSYSLEGSGEIGCLWDPNGVNVLYKGEMPKWLDDTGSSEKLHYYELNESDLLDNHDWLHLYAEVGAFAIWEVKMFDRLPVKVKKAVVQTKEDLLESSSKLNSRNAIFYLTFESHGGVESKCIIRQTSDGKPQHMCLEVSNVVVVE